MTRKELTAAVKLTCKANMVPSLERLFPAVLGQDDMVPMEIIRKISSHFSVVASDCSRIVAVADMTIARRAIVDRAVS